MYHYPKYDFHNQILNGSLNIKRCDKLEVSKMGTTQKTKHRVKQPLGCLIPELNEHTGPTFRFPLCEGHEITTIRYNLIRAMKINKDPFGSWIPSFLPSSTVSKTTDGVVAIVFRQRPWQVLIHPNWFAILPHPV